MILMLMITISKRNKETSNLPSDVCLLLLLISHNDSAMYACWGESFIIIFINDKNIDQLGAAFIHAQDICSRKHPLIIV